MERLQLDTETRSHGSSATAGSTGSHGSAVTPDEEAIPNHFEEEEIVLVGRETQLAQLEEARQHWLRSRKPVVTWISGLSGEGKSSLTEKFLRPLRKGKEMLVLSGRCYDRESVPFNAIDCLLDSLVMFLRGQDRVLVTSWMSPDIHLLAYLFPLLRRAQPIADRCLQREIITDSKQLRYRAFAALRDLLTTISRTIPIVIFVDDLQWGDADSAEAMASLLAPPEAPQVMFLGSFRRDEAASSPFLIEWERCARQLSDALDERAVEIRPLSEAECARLLALRLNLPADQLTDQMHALVSKTQGNPYLLEQAIDRYDPEVGTVTLRRSRRFSAQSSVIFPRKPRRF